MRTKSKEKDTLDDECNFAETEEMVSLNNVNKSERDKIKSFVKFC